MPYSRLTGSYLSIISAERIQQYYKAFINFNSIRPKIQALFQCVATDKLVSNICLRHLVDFFGGNFVWRTTEFTSET